MSASDIEDRKRVWQIKTIPRFTNVPAQNRPKDRMGSRQTPRTANSPFVKFL
jgi:hypothetical protein